MWTNLLTALLSVIRFVIPVLCLLLAIIIYLLVKDIYQYQNIVREELKIIYNTVNTKKPRVSTKSKAQPKVND